MTEQHRHTLLIYGGGAGGPAPAVPQTGFSQPVISSGDCIGAVVSGVCHGTPAPGAATATCHGQMVGGVCTGPMFGAPEDLRNAQAPYLRRSPGRSFDTCARLRADPDRRRSLLGRMAR